MCVRTCLHVGFHPSCMSTGCKPCCDMCVRVCMYVHMYVCVCACLSWISTVYSSHLCPLQGDRPPVVATCLIEEMESPLHLSISGHVDGMAVRYELVKEGGEEQQPEQGQTADPKE